MTEHAADDRPGAPIVPTAGPRIRALDPAECRRLLDRNVVGRIAFALGRQIELLPIHYVHDDGWLYGRTTPGEKVETWQHRRWIAFEVDEVRGLFDWTSVVVRGGLYLLSPDGAAHEAEAWERGVDVLRHLVPATATSDDPTPLRTQLFRIHVDELTGREASPQPGPS